jgi:Domain of unknown function (DUF4388)
MREVSRRTRVRQLAESVWRGRKVNGYANLIATRLRKLAEERSTGALPVSGRGDGAIFFRGGQVVYATSSRTSPPVPRAPDLAALALAQRGAAGSANGDSPHGAGLPAVRSVSGLSGLLELTEQVVDALTELLSNESRYAKFQYDAGSPADRMRPMPVETLLAEVQRRHEVLRQLAVVVTPDTVVTCDPALEPPSVQVSPTQWSLLVRADGAATPRGLALRLGRSVFGTTIEVHRLVGLGLLVVPGRPPAPASGPAGRPSAPALSFIRAVSDGGRAG